MERPLHGNEPLRALSFTTRYYNKTVCISDGTDAGGLAGVSMQRPFGEALCGRARIERFDRDLLRIERRIERKIVAGVRDAEERK
jgi:hypothetical protein